MSQGEGREEDWIGLHTRSDSFGEVAIGRAREEDNGTARVLGDAVGNGGEAFGGPALGRTAAAGVNDGGRCVCKVVVMENLFGAVAIFPGEKDAGNGIGGRDVEVRQGA